MLDAFPRVGRGTGDLVPQNGKHFRWNIDHLIGVACTTLVAAYVIRWPKRIERALGQLLMRDPMTIEFERSLGANDLTGNTYLLRVNAAAREHWREALPQKLRRFLLIAEPEQPPLWHSRTKRTTERHRRRITRETQ